MKTRKLLSAICLLLLINQSFIIAQEHKENAFSYELNYVGDVLLNMNGGIQTGRTYLGMANLLINFDTQKAGFWKGGELFINGANTHGGEPTATLIGDFQTVSNIEAGNITYLHELWYKQNFGQLSFIIGLQDLNAEFASSDFGGMFINSSFGIHSTISDNVPSPIFPLTRPCLQIQWEINKSIRFKTAAFDGLLSDYQGNEYNTNWNLQTNDGSLYIGEFEFSTVISEKPGCYKLGYYHHDHITANENQNTISHNNGFYFVMDQLIYKPANREGGLSVFSQFSYSDPDINNHYRYLGFGLHYCGISNKRCKDEIGLGIAHTWFKTSVSGNETAIELSYKAELGDHIYLQPDLQYVITPAGTEESLENAFVGILRFGLNF